MLIEAESAQEVIEHNHAEPRGLIRMTCPIALLHAHIGDMLAEFLVKYPQVTVHMEASNRRVDVVAEGVDLAICCSWRFLIFYPDLQSAFFPC